MDNKLRKKRKQIKSNIKKEYMNNKDLLRKEPKEFHYILIVMIVLSVLLFVLGIVGLKTMNKAILVLFVIILLIYGLLAVRCRFIERRYKKFREEKYDDIRAIIGMLVEDEAKKLNVSRDQLTIYLLANYKTPRWINILKFFLSTLATAYAVYEVPGYDQVNGGILRRRLYGYKLRASEIHGYDGANSPQRN